MRILLLIVLVLLHFNPAYAEDIRYWPEIHSKHFFYGYPLGTPITNDLIIRDIYALSNNDETKFADWVAYRLDKKTVGDYVKTERKWKPDPWLAEDETIEASDYKGAHKNIHTDRGHQAPLASFRGTDVWHETNYLSNITPQKSALNQGVWVYVENKVRELVRDLEQPIYVMTGTLYKDSLERLPNADEGHKIPTGYWKIIATQSNPKDAKTIQTVAFIFPQNTPRSARAVNYIHTIDEVEKQSGLDFLSALDDAVEVAVEANLDIEWVEKYLIKSR